MEEENIQYVIAANDLPQGERIIVTVDGMEIAVFNIEGEFHAIANYCVHQSGPLAEGELTGSIGCEMTENSWKLTYDDEKKFVACPWHGWKFDITSGKQDAATQYKIPTYDTVIKGSDIYVKI